jgi:hypothetical protein
MIEFQNFSSIPYPAKNGRSLKKWSPRSIDSMQSHDFYGEIIHYWGLYGLNHFIVS